RGIAPSGWDHEDREQPRQETPRGSGLASSSGVPARPFPDTRRTHGARFPAGQAPWAGRERAAPPALGGVCGAPEEEHDREYRDRSRACGLVLVTRDAEGVTLRDCRILTRVEGCEHVE